MDLAKCWKTLPLPQVFFSTFFLTLGITHLFAQCWCLKVDNDFRRIYWLSLAGKGIIWIVQPLQEQLPCGFKFWPPRFPYPPPPKKKMCFKTLILQRVIGLILNHPWNNIGKYFEVNLDATLFFLWAPGIMPPILVTRATAAVPVYWFMAKAFSNGSPFSVDTFRGKTM